MISFPRLRAFSRCGLPLFLASIASSYSLGDTVKQVVMLDPPEVQEAAAQSTARNGQALSKTPANFRRLGTAQVGEFGDAEKLTLRFTAGAKLQTIQSTPDFRVEQGSSCVEGNFYQAKSTCTLLVRFTPKGPGRRLGKLTVVPAPSNAAAAAPLYVGLGGEGYAPAVSFTPAEISTVPATLVNNAGLLLGAKNLAVDGGDTLYIADTNHNLIRYIDSSGVVHTASTSTIQAPIGIAVDEFGEIFFSEPASNQLWEIFDYGSTFPINGTGSATCTYAAPCSISSVALQLPGQMAFDGNNQLFFAEGTSGAAFSNVEPYPATFARLYSPFTYQEQPVNDAFAVDANDNIYSFWGAAGSGFPCEIALQTFSDSVNSRAVYRTVAGGRTCGFSGDGGQARGAEISHAVGQITFDIAGNLYFSDTNNQRVRRVDAATGIIRTIAGVGTAGYAGDNGPANNATLHNPGGVAVDSQGQVYVLSNSATTGSAQVVRKLGPNGALTFFSGQLRGTSSATKTINVANTGNSPLTITKAAFTGANPADFTIDANSTSCNFAAGNSLAGGQSCQLGIIFEPAAAGTRTANLVLLDNSVTNSNTILLRGTGTLPSPAFKITAPASGSTTTSGTTVKFSVSVTSSSGSAPTGKVTFAVDGATFGSAVTVASGAASINLTGLTVKTHTITATYSGDSNYASATVSESIVVKAS